MSGLGEASSEWDPHRDRDAVTKLIPLFLAHGRNSHGGECSLSLHPMTKEWLRSRLPESDRTTYTMEAINILVNYINTGVQVRSLQEARGLLGHLDACMNSHGIFRTATCRLALLHLRKHGLTLSTSYMSPERNREAEVGFQAVLEHDVQEYGQYQAHTIQSTRHLADALVHGAKYPKEHDLLSNALRRSKETMNIETLRIVSTLAVVLPELGRQSDAERYYEKALRGRSLRKDKVERREIYLLYDRLAKGKRFLAKHGQVESFYIKAHRGYRENWAYDWDPTSDMLRAAGGFADLHRAQDQYAEAGKSYREAYEMSLARDHPKTTAMLTNLAISYRNQGTFGDAENYLEGSVKFFRKSLGPDRPDSFRAMMNLSICIGKRGHYKKVDIKYWGILKGREKKLGLNHPDTRRTLERLAHTLRVQGFHDKADTVVRKALTKAGSIVVECQPGSSDHAAFPALTALYTDARKRDQSMVLPDHVGAPETLGCLGLTHIVRGEHVQARQLTEQIQSATSREETGEDQKEPDEEQEPFTPASDDYDVEKCMHHKKVTRSLRKWVQWFKNALLADLPLIIFIFFFQYLVEKLVHFLL
ncbi:MAG: hypothetical protein Q9211_006330 [Gyalolechia sp. 1 TL-2023]